MAEFAMLENPELRDWLGGVEPAWPLLGAANVIALRGVRALSNGPVRIDWSLSNDDVEAAVVLRHPNHPAHRFGQVAGRLAVGHPYGNVFPNTGRKFRTFSGKVFPLLSGIMVAALECPLSN